MWHAVIFVAKNLFCTLKKLLSIYMSIRSKVARNTFLLLRKSAYVKKNLPRARSVVAFYYDCNAAKKFEILYSITNRNQTAHKKLHVIKMFTGITCFFISQIVCELCAVKIKRISNLVASFYCDMQSSHLNKKSSNLFEFRIIKGLLTSLIC